MARRAFLALAAALLAIASCRGRAPAARANRLARESSPYLLLHARDPVDWYPWGEEAFARARREGKPIFLSIGYSSCYWCHVMEREVFSRPEIAALMNRWYVSVLVDREERPEVDEIYSAAGELMNGSAGWPSSLFVTPRLEPFFAGTYFPPGDRDGQPGFPRVLREIHTAWTERHPEVLATAARVAAGVHAALAVEDAPAKEPPPAALARASVAALEARFSPATGSFGGPPNFPQPAILALLWEAGGARGRAMVVASLKAMGRGAIYDQLGGGFHRYTVDPLWRLPHFEKMLYDSAGLGEVAAVAWGATGDPELARIGRGTLDFLLAEMALPAGGFRAALDAETAGVEGAYYTWSDAELRAALGDDGYRALAPVFGFDLPPELPGSRRTLFLTRPLISSSEMAPYLARLRAARARRPRPRGDDKVLADWNGLAIAALARGGRAWNEPRYRDAAARAASFILARLHGPDGTLSHSYQGGTAKVPAYLDDYAFLADGLLTLAETAAEPRESTSWSAEAARLVDEMDRRLADPRGGWFRSAEEPDLLARTAMAADSAVPSGGGIAVLDLLRLARLGGDGDRPPGLRDQPGRALRDQPEQALRDQPEQALRDQPGRALRDQPEQALRDQPGRALRARAERALRALAPAFARSPGSFPTLARAVAADRQGAGP